MRTIKAAWLYALLACLALPALSRALELELEENRAQNGTIGFIDLDRIFQEYPETLRAKAQFEAEVSEKRLDIQRRKREVLDLKVKLADLQVEREKLLKEQLLEPAVIPAAPPAPAVSTAAAASPRISGAAVSSSTVPAAPRMSPQDLAAALAASSAPVQVPLAVAASTGLAPVISLSKSTATALALPLEVAPGGALAVSSAPAISTAALSAAATGAANTIVASSAAVKAPSIPVVSTAALTAATTAVALPAPPAPPAPAASAASEQNALVAVKIKEVDARIDTLQQQIVEKDIAFQDYQSKVEADLRVLEKHRVKLLLGKIYDVVQEVAKDEGLSVVEDKKNILFGQDAVDLTDKVLARLKQE